MLKFYQKCHSDSPLCRGFMTFRNAVYGKPLNLLECVNKRFYTKKSPFLSSWVTFVFVVVFVVVVVAVPDYDSDSDHNPDPDPDPFL